MNFELENGGIQLTAFREISLDSQNDKNSQDHNNVSMSSRDLKTPEEEIDPWKLVDIEVVYVKWADLSHCQKIKRVTWDYIGKFLLLFICMYFFVCSIDLLGNSFRLIGGRTAGSVFRNNRLLGNPVTGLMIGVLTTVIFQSSSTTTGIVISLVVSNVLDVPKAIPMVMGANIGTSVTNTLVALGQVADRDDFRRAFAGATVHDMFNWFSTMVLLPLEVATGYLYHLTKAIVTSIKLPTQADKRSNIQFLKTITKPFTMLIVQVDKEVLKGIASANADTETSILKRCCKTKALSLNISVEANFSSNITGKLCVEKCHHLFANVQMSDTTVGFLLLMFTLILLSVCFFTIVKTLYSLLRGQILGVIKRFINADLPGKLSFLTGYLAILIGTGTTMLIQSSSCFTSALTPLVGIGVLCIKRMYPLTLGANLGTTFTSVLIALSQTVEDMPIAFHVALCHMFFNISGVILFYPIPFMRIPIKLAKYIGNETAKYRWFAILYLVTSFLIIPGVVFGLSFLSTTIFLSMFIIAAIFVSFIVLINILQQKQPSVLPRKLKTWEFVPLSLRSLKPYDDIIQRLLSSCHQKQCTAKNTENNSDGK